MKPAAAYRGGSVNYRINISDEASPVLSLWAQIESRDNSEQTVAMLATPLGMQASDTGQIMRAIGEYQFKVAYVSANLRK